jgi:hypothetical protein
MLDMIFLIGTLISVLIFIYGAYLAIDCALFGEQRTKKTATERPATAHELPEIGHLLG